MNHLEVWEAEKLSESDSSMRAWLQWLRAVQTLLGKPDLDGDDATEGHSLDTASAYFDAGKTPEEAAALFRESIAKAKGGA